MNLGGFSLRGYDHWLPAVSQMVILFTIEIVPVALSSLGIQVPNRPRVVVLAIGFFVLVACSYWRLSFVSWSVYGWVQLFIYALSLANARDGSPTSAAALSRTASSAWVILVSAGLSTVVTLLGAMISTRATLPSWPTSAGADLVARHRNIVFIQVYATSDIESLTALWALFKRGVGMPEFEVSMVFAAGLAIVSLASRYLAITVMLAAQSTGSPILSTESGKLQIRIVQSFMRSAFTPQRSDTSTLLYWCLFSSGTRCFWRVSFSLLCVR